MPSKFEMPSLKKSERVSHKKNESSDKVSLKPVEKEKAETDKKEFEREQLELSSKDRRSSKAEVSEEPPKEQEPAIANGSNDSEKKGAEVVEESPEVMSEKNDAHTGHYSCAACKQSLAGQRYILRNEQSFCINCYEAQWANNCQACDQKIGTDSKDLSYKDKHWHERCFKCSVCQNSLVDKLFGSKGEALYCDNCYDEQFGAKCDKCSLVFKAGMKKLEWNNHQWHEACFTCSNEGCNTVIGCNSFMPKAEKQYCISCFNKLFAPKCKKCSEPIMTGGVLYRNEPYHRDCFGCAGEDCGGNLVGQKFTSRDNKPYCATCFGKLFAKRCTACSQPITGIGGTKFISFDGRHWHNDCFNCNGPGCKENLVGKGFITDQKDILCPNCAKLPYTKREEMKAQAQAA